MKNKNKYGERNGPYMRLSFSCNRVYRSPLTTTLLLSLAGLALAGPFPYYIQQGLEKEDSQFYYPNPEEGGDFEDTAEVEYYQNEWDKPLDVECADGDGMYRVESVHDNKREDRRWRFECTHVSLHTSV